MSEDILIENKGKVMWLRLNRPQTRNALRLLVDFPRIRSAVADAAQDPEVRALVLTGTGQAFCAGADMKEMASVTVAGTPDAHRLRAIVRSFHAVIESIYELEKPVIAAVNGAAVGAGLSLALAADVRIASDQALFSMAFVHRGLTTDGGATYLLPRMVGYTKAFELITLGDRIDAAEALRIGLVSQVVPHEELPSAAQALAERLASGPPGTLAVLKRGLRLGLSASLHDTLENEANMQSLCMLAPEHKEGVTAYLEKRPPKW